MSAPKTNLDKQKRNHIVPIIGIIAIVIITIIAFIWWVGDETDDPQMPGQEGGPVGEVPATTPTLELPPADAPPAASTQ